MAQSTRSQLRQLWVRSLQPAGLVIATRSSVQRQKKPVRRSLSALLVFITIVFYTNIGGLITEMWMEFNSSFMNSDFY